LLNIRKGHLQVSGRQSRLKPIQQAKTKGAPAADHARNSVALARTWSPSTATRSFRRRVPRYVPNVPPLAASPVCSPTSFLYQCLRVHTHQFCDSIPFVSPIPISPLLLSSGSFVLAGSSARHTRANQKPRHPAWARDDDIFSQFPALPFKRLNLPIRLGTRTIPRVPRHEDRAHVPLRISPTPAGNFSDFPATLLASPSCRVLTGETPCPSCSAPVKGTDNGMSAVYSAPTGRSRAVPRPLFRDAAWRSPSQSPPPAP
jgi:hypothetical protein